VTRTLHLAKDVGRNLRLGHPWIYREALRGAAGAPGELCDVIGPGGEAVGRGFYDPDGPIAVRLLGAAAEVASPGFVLARARRAADLRALAGARIDSDGVRLIHGEADFLPGLVLDWYAGVGVARFDGAAAAARWRPHAAEVAAAVGEAGFPVRALVERGGRGSAGQRLLGELPGNVSLREGRCRFEVDVVAGQKTGFFLDQRDNRRLVGAHAAGARVLNLFAYTGGFSIAAALGGARAVTSVERAAPAVAAMTRNLGLNGLDAGQELVTEAVWRFLEVARAARRAWDLVICDPPSFAPSARALPQALRAYSELNRAVAAVVEPGGLLFTASCSSHVTPAAFEEAVAGGLAGRAGARILEARGAGLDHPVLPGFPEGRYLKLLLVSLYLTRATHSETRFVSVSSHVLSNASSTFTKPTPFTT
jgi:23S rRNA (cytosine1962-C5)-methyltransferase